jgi:SOS-response transcriptional repressor LexA
MNTWATRIKERMKDLGLTQEALAEKMGITRGAITHYLAGRRQPPLNQFQKLATILKTEPAWLQFGISTSGAKTKKGIVEQAKNPLPILSWKQIAEGNKEAKEFLQHFYVDQSQWHGLRVKGDSMTAPANQSRSFHDGDIIIVDPDKTVGHGDFVVALLPRSKEATFKQYVVDGGVAYLKPLNPQYPIAQLDKTTIIYGVIVGHLSIFQNC